MTWECYKKTVVEKAKKIFKDVAQSKVKEVKEETKLMVEFARYGENYFNVDNTVRLMVVGRATGIFDRNKENKPNPGKNELAVTEYREGRCFINESRIEDCFTDYENDRLDWIHNKNKEKKDKYEDSKPFFGLIKHAYLKLVDVDNNTEWYKNICYTNVCKIISTCGGNPSGDLKGLRNLQMETMLEILVAEIDYFKPTHILILDSEEIKYYSWCQDRFRDELSAALREEQRQTIKLCYCDRPARGRKYKEDILPALDRAFFNGK